MKDMLESYKFVDLSIFMKTRKDKYLNITDYEFSGNNEPVLFQSDSKFVMSLCFFAMKDHRYVCDVTLEELLELAGIHDSAFLKRFKKNTKTTENDELLATLCAKKIVDYRYGKIIKKDEGKYSFHRQSYTSGNSKKKRVFPEIFDKQFYKA